MRTVLISLAIIGLTLGLWLGLKSAKADLDTTHFVFFYGPEFKDQIYYPLDEATNILKHSKFDLSRPTVLYLHGYIETMHVESIQVIAEAYLKRGDHNILILDWADLAEGSYILDCIPNVKQLGPKLGEIILKLVMEGVSLDEFHVVGHSLGAQLAGYIGRSIIAKSEKSAKLKRITALDPAFPLFYPAVGTQALSPSDADFVDVIHTDAWLYGAPVSTGSVDFWPNSGKTLQPGCPKRNYKMLTDNDLCSHRRSWRFWAESIAEKSRPSFHAIKCSSWSKFKNGQVDKSAPIVHMGIDSTPDLTGDYYLQTNGEIPFSRGIEGTKYDGKL